MNKTVNKKTRSTSTKKTPEKPGHPSEQPPRKEPLDQRSPEYLLANEQLERFLQLSKEIDHIFHDYAKANDISDTSLFILYALARHGAPWSQREMCEEWSIPAQTVNSSLKSLEKQGIVRLDFLPGNRKSKVILLTEKGQALTDDIVSVIINAEVDSFSKIDPESRSELMASYECFVGNFLDEMRKRIRETDKK